MDTSLKVKLEALEENKILWEAEESSDTDSSQSSSDSDSEEPEDDEDVKPIVKFEPVDEEPGEGDFERLVRDIRLNEGSSSASLLAKDWDFSIHDQDQPAYRDELRAASGIGQQRRTRPRGAGPALSRQTKALIGEGNQAYVDGDLPRATRIMLDVIRIEPRAAAAWSVLAQCYEDKKELSKALQLRIMGAHLKNDAEEWDRLARQSRAMAQPHQALYCWAKGYALDPDNASALWDRAMLAKEVGDLRTTRLALLALLHRFPHDLTLLSALRPVLIDLDDLPTCTRLFHSAFEHYQGAFPSPSPSAPPPPFTSLEILLLADLYTTLGEHERAVDVVRKGARWLQGRGAEGYWDLCRDDREFDVLDEGGEGVERMDNGDGEEEEDIEPGYHELDVNARHRLAIARIRMGELDEGKMHASIVISQDILDYAPLFVEIADAYFERELYAEAQAVYELLGTNETTSSVHILQQTAECLRLSDQLKDAGEVYEAGELLFSYPIPKSNESADPENNEVKMKLAEIYEMLNEPRKALDLVYEVIDSRKRKPKEDLNPVPVPDPSSSVEAFSSLIQEKKPKIRASNKTASKKSSNRLSNAELREMEAKKEKEMMEGYRRLKQLWPRMLQDEGDARELWMVQAEKLIEAFRETRRLFSTSRIFKGMFPTRARKLETIDEDKMLSRLQFDIAHDTTARKTRSGDQYNRVDVFRGIGFEDWLRLFFQYSFNHTQSGNFEQANEILRHILLSSAYQLPSQQDSIRIALITCASAAGRFPIVVEQSRKLLMTRQWHNDPMRIMLAALGSGLNPTDAFLMSTLSKFLHREVKLFDSAVNHPELLTWSIQTKRFSDKSVGGAEGFEDDDDEDEAGEQVDLKGVKEKEVGKGRKKKVRAPRLPEIATKPNPIVVALYGQMCLLAKSYQSALFYLLMAYDYCPEDPLISLSIIVASIGRASHRQCDNRNFLVAQAMAFLARYREYRFKCPGQHAVEIEYNFGRTFHHLGLYSHAAKHYERALEENKVKNPAGTVAAEAAYNLSLIYPWPSTYIIVG
ncbi:TPR-like protein [Favolaschia claudopus]|uniref:TPR-like protein n=1 Tax=Favolaschia claudopus TaxID=2862362 RepID=A0AAW0E4G6_9AGAR